MAGTLKSCSGTTNRSCSTPACRLGHHTCKQPSRADGPTRAQVQEPAVFAEALATRERETRRRALPRCMSLRQRSASVRLGRTTATTTERRTNSGPPWCDVVPDRNADNPGIFTDTRRNQCTQRDPSKSRLHIHLPFLYDMDHSETSNSTATRVQNAHFTRCCPDTWRNKRLAWCLVFAFQGVGVTPHGRAETQIKRRCKNRMRLTDTVRCAERERERERKKKSH